MVVAAVMKDGAIIKEGVEVRDEVRDVALDMVVNTTTTMVVAEEGEVVVEEGEAEEMVGEEEGGDQICQE